MIGLIKIKLKMQINQSQLPILFIVLFSIQIDAKNVDDYNDQIKTELILMRNFNTFDIVRELLSQNWTENGECLNELSTIQNGLDNHEPWAIRVVDSWGKVPSGIVNKHRYDLGSFSQCFHIDRNGHRYKTQYCLANVLITNSAQRTFADISLGICLPADCTVDRLESIINDVVRRNRTNIVVKIPNEKCQYEEHTSDWKPIDFITIGIFGIMLSVMIISTTYDMFYSMYNRTKYQPLIVFSVYTNGKKLFQCANSKSSSSIFECLNGIRALSVMWIVIVHNFMQYKHNTIAMNEFKQTYRSTIYLATMSVDTFFVMNGLLVAHNLLTHIKIDGKLNVLSLYCNRLVRLTPILAVVILVNVSVSRFFGSGPMWLSSHKQMADPCERHWWSVLLQIQNYVDPDEMCLAESWYINVDTQLFILSPILVYSIHRFKKTTLFACVFLILCCIAYTLPVYVNNNISVVFQGGYRKTYGFTHFRFPAWFIGFITGYILCVSPEGAIRIPKKFNWCAWAYVVILMPATIIGNCSNRSIIPAFSPLTFGLYEIVGRILWSMCVSYIIFACVHKCGGPINWFLSLPMWQPISKLSYAIYLVHMTLIKIIMASVTAPHSFSEISLIQNSISIITLSAIAAIPLVLAFELPIDAIIQLKISSKKQRTMPFTIPIIKIIGCDGNTLERIYK